MVPVLAGGLWLFNKANRDMESPTAVATSCSGFEADAQKLFDKGDTAALSGTFAPGDHVHLAIDLNGLGYSWELTGVLGKKPDVTGSGWFESGTERTISTTTSRTSTMFNTSTVSRGDITGFARLEVEIDVTTAGDGAITISKTSSMPSFARVAIASCNASKKEATRLTRRIVDR
jgi:hypothetical protein